MIPLSILHLALLLPVEPVKALRDVQGEWFLYQTADEHRTDRGDPAVRMAIKGTTVTLSLKSRPPLTTNTGTLALGTAGELKTVDMKLGNGQSVCGVYLVAADTLVFCVDDGGRDRPRSLVPTGRQWSEMWKRAR